MTENPLVSVWMITYNHEKFIKQAIDSVLMQKTDFKFELVIGEDYSKDKTAEIIKSYQEKYPETIKVNFNNPNIGMMANVINTFEGCTGKYIALCEGDDYWTDPLKLQKQIDFLENNMDYSGCAHQCEVVYENNNTESHIFRKKVPTTIKMKNLLAGRLFHTASFVFKAEIIKKNPLPATLTSADRAIFLLVASFGKIHFFSEPMACYRKNEGGISTWVTAELLEKDLLIVPWIKKINPKFPSHQYYSFVHKTVLRYSTKISTKQRIKHTLWYLYHFIVKYPQNLKRAVIND